MSDALPILRQIIEDAKRERSPKENEAARRYVLGQSAICEYLVALHEEKGKGKV
jgi:hypothetical protein